MSLPSFTVADLEQALEACFVPGSARSIVAAKLIRALTLMPDPNAPGVSIPGNPPRFIAHITIAPLDEESQHMLAAQIANRLAGIESISRSDIHFAKPLLPILS